MAEKKKITYFIARMGFTIRGSPCSLQYFSQRRHLSIQSLAASASMAISITIPPPFWWSMTILSFRSPNSFTSSGLISTGGKVIARAPSTSFLNRSIVALMPIIIGKVERLSSLLPITNFCMMVSGFSVPLLRAP